MAMRTFVGDVGLEENHMSIRYVTREGAFRSTHWHPFMEILFILNGTAEMLLEGVRHRLVAGDLIVVDSNRLHETHCKRSSMGVSIHLSEDYLRNRLGGERNFSFVCSRKDLKREQLDSYLEICECMKKLIPVYLKEPTGYRLELEAIVLDVVYRLITDFSVPQNPNQQPALAQYQKRMQDVLEYIEEHYAEQMSLEDISGHFGLSREYFSRRFKQEVGITFSEHLSRVRLMHIYEDLLVTDDPVMELVEKHGFPEYKHFIKLFREIYGCTPREVRAKTAELNSEG